MSGGLTTPALIAAASNAGALGSMGAAYLTPAQLEADVAAVRARTARPFAINLFAGGEEPFDEARRAQVQPRLQPFRRELGLAETSSALPLETLRAQASARFEKVLELRPAVFSFTFGIPAREQLAALRARGIAVVGSATNLAEAQALEEAQVDAICAQSSEAGGHRGTFIGAAEESLVPLEALLAQLVGKVRLPIIAAGGIMDGAGIAKALALGAAAAQLGTAFLDCPEAGTPPAYRAALAAPGSATVITRAYSGRAARALKNRFTEALGEGPFAPYPQQQQLTKELRAAATAQGRPELMQMFAGEGAPRARRLPAAELIAALMNEAAC
jgi:nitronate monooxygenase